MCGILGTFGGPPADVAAGLDLIAHRGPDGRGLVTLEAVTLGHVRLSIIDPTDASAQPYERGAVTLTYNGELWNYREVRDELVAEGQAFATTGDTEVVAAALDAWGPDALDRLDGMFALAWTNGDGLWLARDRFGEVPLHMARRGGEYWFSSEMKALAGVGCSRPFVDVEPGELVHFWSGGVERRTWYDPAAEPVSTTLDEAATAVRAALDAGTTARGLAADVPVCTLLSGGIDSAATALHLSALNPDLVSYTAVLDPKSRDRRCAIEVADHLGIKLVEVPVEPPTADDLARVVAEIEMPHKAQVEIGWACLALADAMRHDGFKVTFSGEGSDELWASYGMSYHGVQKEGWHPYRKRLVRDQARKNFARCNKVFMARSVEVRLPFLHRPLVELALSLPQDAVVADRRPKAVLERAYADALPPSIIRRPKVAFQDGLGLKEKCADAVADPRRFYMAEWKRLYG